MVHPISTSDTGIHNPTMGIYLVNLKTITGANPISSNHTTHLDNHVYNICAKVYMVAYYYLYTWCPVASTWINAIDKNCLQHFLD